jgi:alpha-1,2-mannosyltransferase
LACLRVEVYSPALKPAVSQPAALRPARLKYLTRLVARYGRQAAWLIWLVAFAIMIDLLLAGRLESIPYHVYAAAGRRWLDRAPLYELKSIDGFQYFPQSALLFAPFAWLGTPVGDVAWRALGWLLYASGIWRLARRLAPAYAAECFLVASCLAVVPATGSLGNGQANLMIAALTLHVAADLISQRWWRATLVVCGGFALKPLMVVLLLLVWALYRPLRWRIPLTLALIVALPWLLRPHAYVVAQYEDCWIKLGMCATPDRLFEDLRGLLATLGWVMPHTLYLVVRLVAALAVLGVCLRARLRTPEPYATFLIASLAVSYLMLFNPRTLSTSYAMTASCAGLLTSLYLLQRRTIAALVLLAVLASWTISYHLFPFVVQWLRPSACIVFAIVLIREVWRLGSDPRALAVRRVRARGWPAADGGEQRADR